MGRAGWRIGKIGKQSSNPQSSTEQENCKYGQQSRQLQLGWLELRAVFKWLSKVITWLRLLRLVIGLKDSRQFFNQWDAKPKPIAPCTRDFSHASSELQAIARNCDWLMVLSAPVVIALVLVLRRSFENHSTCKHRARQALVTTVFSLSGGNR